MKSAVPVPVVCAVVERRGLILLARRPAHANQACKWEFPGGKVEPGERPEDALVRELDEELGCRVEVGRALPRLVHRYERVAIELIPFLCSLASGSPEPHPREHTAVAWVPPAEIGGFDLADADRPVAARLLQPGATPGADPANR